MTRFERLVGDRAALVVVAALVLSAGGLLVASRLPSGIYPEVEFPRIVVVAREQDIPPEEEQKSLARPLESALATVLGVERVRSRTIRGAVELSLQFAPGTDMWRALQMTEARLAEVRTSLPDGTELQAERLTTTSFPVITFNLTGAIDSRRLRELGDLVLRPALSRVRGVGRVEVLGGDVREIEVVLDPGRTAALHLRPAEVADKLRAASVLMSVGRFDESHELVTVLASGEPRTLADIEQLPVATAPDGSAVVLGSIARVFDGAEDRFLRVAGPGGETVLVSVSRLPGASTTDVVDGVLAAAKQVSSAFPPGVRLDPVYDQAALVRDSIKSVRDAILIGIVLCVVVIALFLRDFRAGIVAALAIPITLAASFLAVPLFGQSLNMMSLGGLAVAIGLVVDDAIVVVESIGRRLEEGDSVRTAVNKGPRALFAALLGTTATTVVVFLPLAFLQGFVGRFFTALAVTLSAAVLLSLLVALTVIPVLSLRWLRPLGKARPSRVSRHYARLLRAIVRRPLYALAAFLLVLGAGVACYRYVPSGFLPTMDEGAFVLDYFLPAGTSLTDTDAVARRIETVLARDPDVATYSRRTGAELGPAAATLVNRGDIMVRLRPPGQRKRPIDEVIEDVRRELAAEVPEARTEFVQVLQDVLNDLAGIPRPIEIKLFGEDYAVLRELAAEVSRRIRDVPGLVDLYSGFEGESPELRFRVDQAAATRLGQSARTIGEDLAASLRGVNAGIFRRPDRPIGVRVRFPDEIRFDPTRVENLALAWGPQGPVTVAAVAPLERRGVETVLLRESLRPVVVVTADRAGRDLGGVMRDVQARLRGLSPPVGYRIEIGGQYQGQQRTFIELGTVLGFGLLAVLVVLLAQFRLARHAALVLTSAPIAITGALFTLWATGVPLNASSLTGFILLVGLVVKNGILLVEQFEIARGEGASLEAALLLAGDRRVRPILMTTFASLAGLAPLALGIGSGADLQRPLAIAVMGGLLAATAMTLLGLPALLALADRRRSA